MNTKQPTSEARYRVVVNNTGRVLADNIRTLDIAKQISDIFSGSIVEDNNKIVRHCSGENYQATLEECERQDTNSIFISNVHGGLHIGIYQSETAAQMMNRLIEDTIANQNEFDGPDESDGPWAEGWEQRCGRCNDDSCD